MHLHCPVFLQSPGCLECGRVGKWWMHTPDGNVSSTLAFSIPFTSSKASWSSLWLKTSPAMEAQILCANSHIIFTRQGCSQSTVISSHKSMFIESSWLQLNGFVLGRDFHFRVISREETDLILAEVSHMEKQFCGGIDSKNSFFVGERVIFGIHLFIIYV